MSLLDQICPCGECGIDPATWECVPEKRHLTLLCSCGSATTHGAALCEPCESIELAAVKLRGHKVPEE